MAGHLALILHAHLPFVRHPEHEHFLEEDWLFEAITETYIPLLQMMRRLVNDGVPFKLTMSLTPTLCAMLQDDLLRERYVRHVDLLIDLAARERRRNRNESELAELAQFYFELFSASRRFFVNEWNGDLLAAFLQLRDVGALEIIACAATHGLLPLIYQQSRDGDSSRQVWSAEEGYPGDPAYREFYRDVGFDLPLEHLGPIARGVRKFSGVKYHRITGRKAEKQLYDRAEAEKAADAHAAHFLEQRCAQFRQLAALNIDPTVVVPFDAE